MKKLSELLLSIADFDHITHGGRPLSDSKETDIDEE
jgi:hypothetical protein